MNVKKTLENLEGHSSNLLTFYLGTARKYAVLHPMIFDKDVCKNRGSNKAASGFSIVRNTIFYSVIQDIANIVFDAGRSNPSIVNIMKKLDHESILNGAREKYSAESCPSAALKESYRQREESKRREFDTHYTQLSNLADEVLKSDEFRAAKSVRDEFTAHLELQYINRNYEYPDIKQYGLKWGSPKIMLDQLKPLISSIGYVVRNAEFSWKRFETKNADLSTEFWEAPRTNRVKAGF